MDAEIREMKNRQVLPKPNQNPVGLEAVQKTKKSSSSPVLLEDKEINRKKSTTEGVVKKPLKTPFKEKENNNPDLSVVVQEGEDEDDEIRNRRDKVKAVSKPVSKPEEPQKPSISSNKHKSERVVRCSKKYYSF